MRWARWLTGAGAFALAGVYLFVSAPPALPDGAGGGRRIPAETALALLDAENAAIRALYTREIVGEGTRRGLAFREDWKREDVAAGPLPALLLRETSNRLQMRVPELGLFLGSDHPLVKENLFKGVQAEHYQQVRKTLRPHFYFDAAQGRTTAMFPDLATAQACITCHNEHPQTPKKDWVLDEPMGATTWSYAGREVSSDALLRLVRQLRGAAVESYAAYLKKVDRFEAGKRPVVGDKWPRDGLFLPDEATFRQAVESANSARTLNSLFLALEARPPAEAP